MADTLLDILNRGTQTATSQPAAGAGSTDTLSKLLAARSGRAPSPNATPRGENLAESAAIDQTRSGLSDLRKEAAPKIDAVARASADVSQQSAQAQAKLAEQSRRVSQTAALDAQKLLDRAYAERTDLRSAENRGRAEQIGLLIRLSNDRYIDQLQRAGIEARATDEIGFREAYQKTELAGLFDLFGDQAAQKKLLAMDSAAFEEEMGRYSADWEIYFQRLGAKQANSKAMFEGASSLISGGAKAYGESQRTPNDTEIDTSGAGENWEPATSNTGSSLDGYGGLGGGTPTTYTGPYRP
jgi:hypothetical protein